MKETASIKLYNREMLVRVPMAATFFLHKLSRPKTGSNQPPSQGVLGVHSLREIGRCVKQTTLLHLVTRKRMCGAIAPIPMCLQGVNRYSFTSTLPQMWNTVGPYSEVLVSVANPVPVTD